MSDDPIQLRPSASVGQADCCGNCTASFTTEDNGVKQSICREGPPACMIIGGGNVLGVQQVTTAGYWPPVNLELGWCRRHERRPGSGEAA